MLGLIFIAPFLLLLVIFTLSNTGTVALAFWPTDLQLEAPLSVAVLVVSAVFFVLGAVVAGLGSLGPRGRARRAERQVRALEAEVAALKQRPTVVRQPGSGLVTINS